MTNKAMPTKKFEPTKFIPKSKCTLINKRMEEAHAMTSGIIRRRRVDSMFESTSEHRTFALTFALTTRRDDSVLDGLMYIEQHEVISHT